MIIRHAVAYCWGSFLQEFECTREFYAVPIKASSVLL